jgi:uncharacterized protein (TIGR02300 family)
MGRFFPPLARKGLLMTNENWGVKRMCPTTGRRFYDLNRSPVVSPYTGEIVDIDGARRKGPVAAPRIMGEKGPKDLEHVLEGEEDILVADDAADTELEDELLEADEDETVSLDDLAEVGGDDEE